MDQKKSTLDALHGWLVLAPLVLLCAPPGYSFFDGAPDTTSIGVGVAVLSALPAVLLSLVRGRGDRALLVIPLIVTVLSAVAVVPRVSDSFGGWRSLLGLIASVGFAVSGASLGPSGRRILQRGLGATAVLLLLASPMAPAWTGALGNTGDLSEAALPCAILGAGAFLTGTGFFAFAGFASILLFALYAGYVPAYAGLVSLAAAVLVAGLGSIAGRHGGEAGRKGSAKRLRILLVALLVGLVPITIRQVAASETGGQTGDVAQATAETDEALELADEPSPAAAASTTTGGFEFRRLTWARMPDFFLAHPTLGVGPGQFQAAFPPFRDPREIELSSLARAEPTPIEVEHAHSDWLTGLVEHGLLGGGSMLLFMLIVLWRGTRATWGGDSSQRDFGLAAVAVLVNALFNSPLFYGPAAPAIAFAIFGVVCAPAIGAPGAGSEHEETGVRTSGAGSVKRYLLPALSLIALGLAAPRALGLVEYGRALAATPSARVVTPDGKERLDAAELGRILAQATEAAPDSPIALEKEAQLLSRTGAPLDAQGAVLTTWNRVRPHSFAASLGMGVLHAKKGELDRAAEYFERARALDKSNPLALQNLLRVACDRRDAARAEEALVDLDEAGLLTLESLRSIGSEMLLGGRLEVAAPIIRRLTAPDGPREESSGQVTPAPLQPEAVDVLDANSTYAAREAAREADDELLEDAYNVAFQLVIALDHLKRGLPAQAAVSTHQALQAARGRGIDIGPIRLRKAASKAAAAMADGTVQEELLEEARAILGEAPIRDVDRAALTELERDRLRAAGLL